MTGEATIGQEFHGPWRFQIDPYDWGEADGWFAPAFDRSGWAVVKVPGAWDLYEEALRDYEGIGWYAVEIPAHHVRPDTWQRLCFNYVNIHAKVWLNGHYLGEHVGGFLPFEFAATPYLFVDRPNILVVRVDNRPRPEWLPGSRTIEWVLYGGILKPVRLVTTGQTYISDLTVTATPAGAGAEVRCQVEVTNVGAASFSGEVIAEVLAVDAPARAQAPLACAAGEQATADLILHLDRAHLWSPVTPALYTLNVTLRATETDAPFVAQAATRFGVRTITVQGSNILLNGEPVTIKGVCRYNEYAGYGMTLPAEVIREDLLRAKRAGVNFIRIHYPQDPLTLDLMDELGFLVMMEPNFCWWGVEWFGPVSHEHDEQIFAAALRDLEAMIRAHKNHPCLVAWSMINESATDTEAGIAIMRRMMRKAKALDPTRLVTFVAAGSAQKHLAFDEADFVSTNWYLGTFTPDKARRIADIEGVVRQGTVEYLTAVQAHFGGKPVVVTEFGTQGIYGLRGDTPYTEEYQAAYIEAMWSAIRSVPGVAGAVLWCWADYPHRRDFITYAPYGPYGVVTFDRKAKVSSMTLARMFGGETGG